MRPLPYSNLIDILLYDGKAVLSDSKQKLTKPITLTRLEAEKQIEALEYTGWGRKRDEAIETTRLPPFILAFYSFVFDEMRIPTEEELFSRYAKQFLITNSDGSYALDTYYGPFILDKEGLLGRMLRSYPSLIRDFHFYLLCAESGLFQKVVYSLNQDYFEGIDLLIIYNGKPFNIDMFIDTPNAIAYRAKKQARHTPTKIPRIELKVSILSKKGIPLYSDSTLSKLFNVVKENVA